MNMEKKQAMDTNYIYPDIDFLRHNEYAEVPQNDDGVKLIAFLKLMRISAKVAYVETSSVSVLYAIELAPGIRVSCKKQVKSSSFRQFISSTFRQLKTSTFISAI